MKTIKLPAQLKAKNQQGRYDILGQHAIWDAERIPVESVEFQWKSGDCEYAPVWYLLRLPEERLALLCCFEDDVTANDARPHCMRRTIGVCDRTHLGIITAIARGVRPRMAYNTNDDTWSISCEEAEPDSSLWRTGVLYDEGHGANYSLRINLPTEQRKAVTEKPFIPVSAPRPQRSCLLSLLPWFLLFIALGCCVLLYIEKQENLLKIEKLRGEIASFNQVNDSLAQTFQEETAQLRKEHKVLQDVRKRVDELHQLLNTDNVEGEGEEVKKPVRKSKKKRLHEHSEPAVDMVEPLS